MKWRRKCSVQDVGTFRLRGWRIRQGPVRSLNTELIHFFVTEGREYPIQDYIDDWVPELSDSLKVHTYSELFTISRLPPGALVFCDLERLGPDSLDIAASICKAIQEQSPNTPILNYPGAVKTRYSLHKTLYEMQQNDFRTFRASESIATLRFPCFIREECDHTGALTRLVETPSQLYSALAQVRLRGYRLHNLLITEFCDTADQGGIIRKYSAFAVGGKIIPRHIFFSTNWLIKNSDIIENSTVREESQYLHTNPHLGPLQQIFAVANIDFGRIDYGVDAGGNLQVWEINTNPVLLRRKQEYQESRLALQYEFAELLASALRSIQNFTSDGDITIDCPLDAPQVLAKESARIERGVPNKKLVALWGDYPSLYVPVGKGLQKSAMFFASFKRQTERRRNMRSNAVKDSQILR